jgi:hypothetical protein
VVVAWRKTTLSPQAWGSSGLSAMQSVNQTLTGVSPIQDVVIMGISPGLARMGISLGEQSLSSLEVIKGRLLDVGEDSAPLLEPGSPYRNVVCVPGNVWCRGRPVDGRGVRLMGLRRHTRLTAAVVC